MAIFSGFAVYFIFWWITLFAILPLGLRTQAEENQVVPGTVESAPAKFRFRRIMLMTTVVSAILFGIWYLVFFQLGFSLDSIPRIVPKFD